MGKGSNRRPIKTDRKEFEDNWTRIFGQKSPNKSNGKEKANGRGTERK